MSMSSLHSDSFAKKDQLSHALATLGLHDYVDKFVQTGWDDIGFIRTLSTAELEGVARDVEMPPDHATRFVALISEQQANPKDIPGQHSVAAAPLKISGLEQLHRGASHSPPIQAQPY